MFLLCSWSINVDNSWKLVLYRISSCLLLQKICTFPGLLITVLCQCGGCYNHPTSSQQLSKRMMKSTRFLYLEITFDSQRYSDFLFLFHSQIYNWPIGLSLFLLKAQESGSYPHLFTRSVNNDLRSANPQPLLHCPP